MAVWVIVAGSHGAADARELHGLRFLRYRPATAKQPGRRRPIPVLRPLEEEIP